MKNSLKKQFITLIIGIITNFLFIGCGNSGNATAIKAPTKEAPIAGTQEQQDIFRATFATEIGKDSVWVTAFEKAFAGAFGADSLKQFLSRKTLPNVAFGQNYEMKGTERGNFVINNGVTLIVSGVAYGRVEILKGGALVNRGTIYGTIENRGGQFEDTGFHQGALVMH